MLKGALRMWRLMLAKQFLGASDIWRHLGCILKGHIWLKSLSLRYQGTLQAFSASAISGATDTVLTALSRVSVARTPSTPER